MSVIRTGIVETPISTDELAPEVVTAASGASVTFSGIIRDHDSGRGVERLVYESHPLADQQLAEAAAAVSDAPTTPPTDGQPAPPTHRGRLGSRPPWPLLGRRLAVGAVLAAAVLAFAYFWPIYTGEVIPFEAWNNRMWNVTWR